MLFYKSWRESRVRFLISVLILAGICTIFVLFHQSFRNQMHATEAPLNTYIGYIYQRIYAGFARGMFLTLALVLGLGGLQRERAHGSAGFTLALPVSRLKHVAIRAAVGLLEILILATIPLTLVPSLSRFVGEAYPLSQAAQFWALWICVGFAVFAAAFLASSMFTSEYTAMVVSFVAFFIYPLAVRIAPLRPYPLHIHYIMNGTGMAYFDPHADLLIGPFPWAILAGVTAVGLVFLVSATVITQRQDFS